MVLGISDQSSFIYCIMTSELYFALLRISCTHILRAAGIDRCSSQILDIVTDIVMRHLMLLACKCSRNAELSGRPLVEIQDVSLALEQIGLIHPRCILDPFDTDPNGVKGFNDFIDWIKGPVPEQARRLSKQAMPDPTIATAGSLMLADKLGQANSEFVKENGSDFVQTDWLVNLSRKRAKIGQEKRFKGTILSSIAGGEEDDDDNVIPDVRIAGGPLSIEEFYETVKKKVSQVHLNKDADEQHDS